MSPEKKLAALTISLPAAPVAAGNYVPAVRTGNLLYCAGTIPMVDGKLTHTGQVGREQTVASASESARVCTLNALASIKAALGSLDKVSRVVSVTGFVNAVEGFADSPAVVNGASDLLVAVFGEAGRHARVAVGVSGLPKNATTEIQLLVEVREGGVSWRGDASSE
ncbi:MAG: RidA family protein [Opitutaceae bacterium]|jgi:enamine deaminase RidA (YjgF/YER057c/UK114 family)|nr:RidA family protein [Opitutaceae bacterium]